MNQEEMEEYAFYESGLCADGCLEKLDEYAKQCIKRYGRIILNQHHEQARKDGYEAWKKSTEEYWKEKGKRDAACSCEMNE
jgi:hypothetical protein